MTLDDFAEFCSELTLENGEQMELHDFQRQMLAPYFVGCTENVILAPKKQGKTCLLSALGIFHLLTTADADCRVVASSKDQASLLYDAARGFVRRTEALTDHITIKRGYRELRSAHDDGFLRVMAADTDTLDGIRPSLALIDEQARAKSSEGYAICRDGLGPRGGRLVCISTAGDDETSVLGELRRKAYALPGFKRDAANRMHRFIETPRFAFHEWALDPTDDRDDLDLVLLANPAPWQTREALAARHDSPSMRPWEWARFACGIWQAGEDAAISDIEWRRCAEPGCDEGPPPPGVHIGLDLAYKQDTTAFCPVYLRDGVAVVCAPTILHRPDENTAIQVEDIVATAHELDRRYPEAVFVLDPQYGGEVIAQRLDAELKATIMIHSQAPRSMATAAGLLVQAIANRQLVHPAHPELNAHVLSAAARPVGEGFRFIRPRGKAKPIDALIALAMAVRVLLAESHTTEAPGRMASPDQHAAVFIA